MPNTGSGRLSYGEIKIQASVRFFYFSMIKKSPRDTSLIKGGDHEERKLSWDNSIGVASRGLPVDLARWLPLERAERVQAGVIAGHKEENLDANEHSRGLGTPQGPARDDPVASVGDRPSGPIHAELVYVKSATYALTAKGRKAMKTNATPRIGRWPLFTAVGASLLLAGCLADDLAFDDQGSVEASLAEEENYETGVVQALKGEREEEQNSAITLAPTYDCGTLVPATFCPVPAGYSQDGARCDQVPAGSYCEADGECGTSNSLNNCAAYDWYFKRTWAVQAAPVNVTADCTCAATSCVCVASASGGNGVYSYDWSFSGPGTLTKNGNQAIIDWWSCTGTTHSITVTATSGGSSDNDSESVSCLGGSPPP